MSTKAHQGNAAGNDVVRYCVYVQDPGAARSSTTVPARSTSSPGFGIDAFGSPGNGVEFCGTEGTHSHSVTRFFDSRKDPEPGFE